MGISGAGKTTLARELQARLNCAWINADEIRKKYNDWDFSEEGRIRQSQRMREQANLFNSDYVIADFIAPLTRMREEFSADFTIWMDTIQQSQFADTDRMFVRPTSIEYNLRIKDFNYNIDDIIKELL